MQGSMAKGRESAGGSAGNAGSDPANPGEAALERVKALTDELAGSALPELFGEAESFDALMRRVESGETSPKDAARTISKVVYTAVSAITVLARLNGEGLPPSIASLLPRLRTLMSRAGLIKGAGSMEPGESEEQGKSGKPGEPGSLDAPEGGENPGAPDSAAPPVPADSAPMRCYEADTPDTDDSDGPARVR